MPGTSPLLSGLDLADRTHGLDASEFRRVRPNRDPDRCPARCLSPSSCPDLIRVSPATASAGRPLGCPEQVHCCPVWIWRTGRMAWMQASFEGSGRIGTRIDARRAVSLHRHARTCSTAVRFRFGGQSAWLGFNWVSRGSTGSGTRIDTRRAVSLHRHARTCSGHLRRGHCGGRSGCPEQVRA